MKVGIVGGGAGGLISAIEIKRNSNFEVIIFEKMDRVGKKILATGNGRCNYTNINASSKNYYSIEKGFVDFALKEFDVQSTINFFNELGVFPREEKEGKLYPFSEQATAILDCLRNEIERLKVEVRTSFKVEKVKRQGKGFKVIGEDGESVYCDKVIIASGGCASPSLGSDGSGFKILESLGHSVSKLAPVLVQIKTDVSDIKGLKGIKFDGNVSLLQRDKLIGSCFGEVLFTEYGLSGPPIFQLSTKTAFRKNLKISIDFMSEYSPKEVYDILENRKENLSHLNMEAFFSGLLNKRIGNVVAKRAGIEKLSFPVSKLERQLLWKMASIIKDFELEVVGVKGFSNAQVTAGGVYSLEFDKKSMESKIVKGLYACGEVLDVYGDCGGYNLQWAWSSGRLAGRAIVKEG